MKNITTILIVFFLSVVSLQAQLPDFPKKNKQDDPKAHFLELGINANWLIRQVLPAGENAVIPTTSPYLITARWGRNNWAFRLGAGGSYKREEIQLEGFGDKEIFFTNSLDLRLGFEKRYRLGEKLVANLGLDVTGFYANDEEIVDSGFDRVTTAERLKGFGFGPVLGLSYFFTPRLACFVEGSVVAQFSQSESARLFKNFPQFDDEIQRVKNTDVNVQIPATIYLAFFF